MGHVGAFGVGKEWGPTVLYALMVATPFQATHPIISCHNLTQEVHLRHAPLTPSLHTPISTQPTMGAPHTGSTLNHKPPNPHPHTCTHTYTYTYTHVSGCSTHLSLPRASVFALCLITPPVPSPPVTNTPPPPLGLGPAGPSPGGALSHVCLRRPWGGRGGAHAGAPGGHGESRG